MAQQDVFDYCVTKVADKPADRGHHAARTASSSSPCSSSPAPAPAAPQTAYARLITQLYGDHMYISNATGCSSIWGGPAATSPVHGQQAGPRPRMVQLACSRTTPSTAWACSWATRPSTACSPPTPPSAAWRPTPPPTLPRLGSTPAATRPPAVETADALIAALPEVAAGEGAAAEAGAAHPGPQGVPGQEVRLDLRRRRLGLRHRLRRSRPRAGIRRGREHLRVRHRGLLQHRRPGFQGFQHRPGGAVRRRRQGRQEEVARRDRHGVRLRVRGAGGHGRQAGPDASRPSPRPRHITARP